MIVEFYGPPGSGKTTFAKALVERLQASGKPAILEPSARPAEAAEHGRLEKLGFAADIAAVLKRLLAAALEFAAILRRPFANAGDFKVAFLIVRTYPIHGFFGLAREWQYIVRLCNRWRKARHSDVITVFDQGTVQLVCSLALATERLAEYDLASALSLIPNSDLAIRVDTPEKLIEQRVSERDCDQGRLERFIEHSSQPPVAGNEIFIASQRQLMACRRNTVVVSSIDPEVLAAEVARIEAELQGPPAPEQKGAFRVPDPRA